MRPAKPAFAFLLPAVLLLAGCVQTAPVEQAAAGGLAPVEDALARLEAGEPSANVRLLGEFRDGPAAEMDAWGDLLFVMSSGTVRILDVSDPADVREVAVIDPPHRVLDVKVSDDGRYLFVGDDTRLSGVDPRSRGGLYVYDVGDPARPTLVTSAPVGPTRGPHMVAYHRMPDGRELVFGANADISIHAFDRDKGTLTPLARYEPDPVFGYNRDPQVVDVLYQLWAHDMFVMNEPDGSTLLYVANWDAGLRIVDVTDPAAPREVGHWNDFPDGHAGNLHTVVTEWIDGRRITVGSVEVGFAVVGGYHYARGTEANVVYVWDTTDPAAPELVGQWQNPVEPYAKRDHVEGEITSTHNVQLENGRVYLAHYRMGAYVLDVSTPAAQASPVLLGYHVEAASDTWDVVLHKGALWTGGGEGVLALHYVADALGEAGPSGRA